MPVPTVRLPRVALAAGVLALFADGAAAQVPDAFVHRDGFEPIGADTVVRNAVDQSQGIRVAIGEHWYSTQQLPASLTALGFNDPSPAGTALATLPSGVLILDFSGELAGESLGFAAWNQAGQFRWTCGNAPPPLDATLLSSAIANIFTTFDDSVLPDHCRTDPLPATLVHEAWLASASARNAVTEHWYSDGMPDTLAEIGLLDPTPIARARLHLDDGLLVATFVAPLEGETLAVAPWLQGGMLRWVCGHAPAPLDATPLSGDTSASRTSLDASLLPQDCSSQPSPATQVWEALTGMAAARLAVNEAWVSNGVLPATLAAAGLVDPLPVGQARVQLDVGVLVATFVGGELDGERFGVAPWEEAGTMRWVCGHAAPPPNATPLATAAASAKTTLAPALLPASCR